ncbi:MAG: hypothetical protein H6Q48_3761 [Deltaproteobacteria bacterium]|jgi:hypothetical protein|nr:hypothetical protein [Deltaproteobacteria bacterium]
MEHTTRCARCILPSSYPDIEFDKAGVCSFCQAEAQNRNLPKDSESKANLDKIIRAHKRKNAKYDAIVGLSGGKDSTYVAYYLKKEYDLKILGFNYDIGYRSHYAIQNLEMAANKLDMDLVTIRPKKSFLVRLFAHFLKNRGEFCSVCNNLGYLMGASFVRSQKVSLGFSALAVGGWSKKYEFQQSVSVTSMQYFFQNLTDDLFQDLLAQPFIDNEVVMRFKKLHDPRQAQIGSDGHKQLGEYAMNFIQLPDYIDWNIRQIPHILSRELGWAHPDDLHESHFDCLLFPIKEYLKFKKYGLSQETIKNSVLIREGLMTRDEALERARMEQTQEPPVMKTFLDEVGLTKADIDWDAEWSTR